MFINKNVPIAQIPFGYYQVFQNDFTLNINDNQVIKSKNNNKITKFDVKIIEFVKEQVFVTAEQLNRFIELYNFKGDRIDLENLVSFRLLNRFFLSEKEAKYTGTNKQNALIVYCMDIGGKYLLQQYSNIDVTNWHTTINMCDSIIVSKMLMGTEFYFRLKETVGDNLVHYEANPHLRINREKFVPSAEFTIKDGVIMRYFIGEIVRKEDYPTNLRSRTEQYIDLLESYSWKKYYYHSEEPPVLFYITDTDSTARIVGRNMYNATNVERYRLTTIERIQQPLGSIGAFLKYLPNEDKLQMVRSGMFKYADDKKIKN